MSKTTEILCALGAVASSFSILALCWLSIANTETPLFRHDIVGGMMIFFGLAFILFFVVGTKK
jgi:hypothetical protein